MDLSLKKLLDEREILLQRIRQDQQRIAEIEEFARLHQKLLGSKAEQSALPLAMAAITKRDRILSACDSILVDGVRRSTRELLRELEKRGIEIGGKDPAMYLSSYLSREKDRYSSDRKEGWMLIRPSKKSSPEDVSASTGLLS